MVRILTMLTKTLKSNYFSILLMGYLLTIPLNNCFEIAAMMQGTLLAQDDISAWALNLTPAYLRIFKDIFFLASLVLLGSAWLESSTVRKLFKRSPFPLLHMIAVLLLGISLYSFTFMPTTVVLMGIRGFWTLGFVYVGAAFHQAPKRRIYLTLLGVFALHFLMQVIEAITDVGYAVYFEHRSPGIFIIPATAGIFALVIYGIGIEIRSTLIKVAALASLLLSSSSTGRLVLIVYYMYAYRNKVKPKILFYPIYGAIVALAGIFIVLNLAQITGRTGASDSALTRLGLIVLALSNWSSLLLGNGMGIATSQAVIAEVPNAIIADNTYLGMTYNAGFLPAILLLIFAIISFRYFKNKLFFFTLFAYSMTTVIFEISPVIQILLIFLGFDIGNRYAGSIREPKATPTSPLPEAPVPHAA